MEYNQKASLSKNIKNTNMILICIIGSISLLGVVMAIYSVFKAKFLFTLIYIFAVALGLSYVVMRINTIIPTNITRDEMHLFIQNWENGLFPYRCDKGFWGEFIPAKTVITRVNISAISKIYLGTRNYLLKLLTEGNLHKILTADDKKYLQILKKMDFLYILTKDNKELYMSVTGFDEKELAELLKPIVEENERIDFRCNNRYISKEIPPRRITF